MSGAKAMVGLVSLALFALVSACTKTPPPPDTAKDTPKVRAFVFKHQGILRDVGVFDPRPTVRPETRPLVVVLHGGLGEDDDTVSLSFGKLNDLAEDDRFVVAYPVGLGGHWNDGRRVESYVSQRERIDDVGFLTTLIEDLVLKKQIDPDAVFMVGVSDGAMMAHRFACERTGRLHGMTAVIGSMPRNVARRRSRCGKSPLSVLMINGTDDPIVPWDGGEVVFGDVRLGRVLPVPKTFEFWTRHNGCSGVERSMIPDFAPGDGTRIERSKATGCRGDTKVELFGVEGAGHTWPSGWQYLPAAMVGRTSHDIDAAVAAWRFFQSTL
ncbi:MAG: PHB depolymerase family esterase [Myxococcota bacterium]